MDRPYESANIKMCPDGKYRWVYEYKLLTNPTIFLTVFKIFAVIIVVGTVLLFVTELGNAWFWKDPLGELVENLRFGGMFLALFLVLTIIGYLVYAAMNGGSYCAVFAMDEKGVEHKQLPKQYKKAEVINALNVLVGAATGNVTTMGIGLMGTRDSMRSDFATVRSIKPLRRCHTIKVNEPFAKNQVYVEPQDWDFVYGFIVEHCPNARVK